MVANPHPNAHPGSSAYTNAPQIAAEVVGLGVRAQAKAFAKVAHHGMLLETRVKANASGRPGPRSRSGDYRSSWTSRPSYDGDTIFNTVGTNKPQGRRLEHGFVGADRIGRVFNQPPFPHLAPAVDAIRPAYMKDMANIVSWGGTR